ncbi:MAG: AAA family ATPase, partial [Alphaproteobacteria bacterium]|nr:AAA family ATPase [Alphaproteobacteria bacterium]
ESVLDDSSFNTPESSRLSKVIAIIGANGAGKTSLLKGLSFISWFISKSFNNTKQQIPYERHFFADTEKSEFGAVFEIGGSQYHYELVIDNERVESEVLFLKTSNKYSYVFKREWNFEKNTYDVKQKWTGFEQAEKSPKNASLVSAESKSGFEFSLAGEMADYTDKIHKNIIFTGRKYFDFDTILDITAFFVKHEKLKNQMTEFLHQMDSGLNDVIFRKSSTDTEVYTPFGVHNLNGHIMEIPFNHESNGLQSAYVLLGILLPVLENGGIAVIDEIDNSLHPHVLEKIVDLFNNPEANPHNGQLIFTTHSHAVLNNLHKHQILLVEKNEQQISEIRRLDKVSNIHSDDNLFARYNAGAYGAVPYV